MTKLIFLISFVIAVFVAPEIRADLPGFMKAQMGTMTGKVELPVEMPKHGVLVSFFNVETGPPPTITTPRRVPDMVTYSTPEGTFEVQLMPGIYNIGVLIREREAGLGPPRPGEQFFFATADKDKLFESPRIQTKETTNVGTVKLSTPPKAPVLNEYFTIEGVVSNENGPVKGAVVLVKTDLNQIRPSFISEPTAENGSFRLNLVAGKKYYLLARQGVDGGRPTPGSYIGTYGKTPPPQGKGIENRGNPSIMAGSGGMGEALAITGKAGEKHTGVNISMFRIPDPEANRAKYQKEGASKTKSAIPNAP